MKIHIRGKYSKHDQTWKVEIAPLGLSFEASSAIRAFHLLHQYLKNEIHQKLGCDIRIQDHGEFLITTHTNHSETNSWLKAKILLSNNDPGEILDQIIFEEELDDDGGYGIEER